MSEPHPSLEDDFDLILLGPMEERPGSKQGNVRIRVTLPRHQPFHRIKEGVLEATEAVEVPEGTLARGLHGLKRALIGVPISSIHAEGVAYPLLRVESEEVEVERLGGVPPGLLRPPSIEPFDL